MGYKIIKLIDIYNSIGENDTKELEISFDKDCLNVLKYCVIGNLVKYGAGTQYEIYYTTYKDNPNFVYSYRYDEKYSVV